jgi:hypothetical protein
MVAVPFDPSDEAVWGGGRTVIAAATPIPQKAGRLTSQETED